MQLKSKPTDQNLAIARQNQQGSQLLAMCKHAQTVELPCIVSVWACQIVRYLMQNEPATAHVLHGPHLQMAGGPC